MSDKPMGVGMVGYAFMGRAHSLAWREAARFFDVGCSPHLKVLAGRNADAVSAAADRLGFAETVTDWRELVTRDDIDVVDICTPGDLHAEIAIAALAAGKHVLCEKPLANSVPDALAMCEAAAAASARGVQSMVGFNYRRIPAAVLARTMIADGKVGEVRHVRATYLQDWIVDPQFPLVWRLQAEHAGSGALGDIGSHIVDLAQFMIGDVITGVSAMTKTFITERPLPSASAGLSATAGADRGPVTVDDAALFLARFGSGAIGTFEATRLATGRKNELRIEINGSAGSVVFNMESMNELLFYDGTQPDAEAGFRRILVTEPEHPYLDAWWPPGHLLGWDHSFVHEIRDFLRAVTSGQQPRPSFADGLQVQQVLTAVQDSADAAGSWRPVSPLKMAPA